MEILEDKIRIHSLLHRLMEKRSLLVVRLEGQQHCFNSAIIQLDSGAERLMLDELKPEHGDKLLRQNPNLHISARIEGISIAFDATITEFGTENGIPFYTLTIPSAMDYHQQRQSVRIQVSAANPLPVKLSSADGTSVSGTLENISLGGLRARFSKRLPPTLAEGQCLSCSFLLPPDMEKLNCDFIIRAIKHEPDQFNPAFIGGQFFDIQKSQERQLQRAIMTLQRASQQKKGV